MSDTPRTDAESVNAIARHKYSELSFLDMRAHAERLERENAAMRPYLNHKRDCYIWEQDSDCQCDCGFDALKIK